MSMVHTYAPLGEGSQDLWLERSNLTGAVLGGVAYGRQLVVVDSAVHAALLRHLHSSERSPHLAPCRTITPHELRLAQDPG